MTDGNCTIRQMTRGELDVAVDWAEKEGWNPGNYDAQCFYTADPGGFFIGHVDDIPVATASGVIYDDEYSFLGFYIVKEEYRNRGFGVRIWDAIMDHVEERNAGLDSVRPDLVSHVRPEFQRAYTNLRHQWIKDQQWSRAPQIIPLSHIDFKDLSSYDRELFLFPRDEFLKCWITRPNTLALGIMNKGRLGGYGVLRECRNGFKIGPLFADDEKSAEELFQGLVSEIEIGVPIFLDTPEANPASIGLAKRYNMNAVFQTTRMYNRGQPNLPLERWFGATTFELG